MMSAMRNLKKMKGPMTIFIILLVIGLVGSGVLIAFGGDPRQPVGPNTELGIEQQILFFEQLLGDYTALLENDPENQETLWTLAEIHLHLAELHEGSPRQHQELNNSLVHLSKILEHNPDDVNIMTQVASVAYSAGRDDLTEDIVERALQLLEHNPDDISLLASIATLTYTVGQDDLAQGFLERVIQLDGGNAVIFTHYGVILSRQGDFEGALAQFERALEMDMDDLTRDNVEALASFSRLMIEFMEDAEGAIAMPESELTEEIDNDESEDVLENGELN